MALDFDDFDKDADHDISAGWQRTAAVARTLGECLAVDDSALAELLPELVTGRGRLWDLGQGMAKGTPDRESLWRRMAIQLGAVPQSGRNLMALCGFLNGLHADDSNLANALLDEALEDDILKSVYPVLQTAVRIDEQGAKRLRSSLALGFADVGTYSALAWRRATDPIPPWDLKEILLTIASKEYGFDVALEILSMRLHSDNEKKKGVDPEFVKAGCELLRQIEFHKKRELLDYRLGSLVKSCLLREEDADLASDICRKFRDAISKREIFAWDYNDFLSALFATQPAAVLTALCSGDAREIKQGITIIRQAGMQRQNPIDCAPEDKLLIWCNEAPQLRYPIAAAIVGVSIATDGGGFKWSSVALALLNNAPDRIAVLKEFVSRFRPSGGWSGSLATILASKAKLLDSLEGSFNFAFRDFVAQVRASLNKQIQSEYQRETLEDRIKDERFE